MLDPARGQRKGNLLSNVKMLDRFLNLISMRMSYSSVLVASPTPASISATSVGPQSVLESLFNTPEHKPDPLKTLAEKFRGKRVQDDKPLVHAKGQSPSQIQMIFAARNVNTYNVLKLDLHGLHVKSALERLKAGLSVSAYFAVWEFLIVTGCGIHSKGKPMIKEAITTLLKKEDIRYEKVEGNDGALKIYLDGRTDFSSLETDSD